MLKLCGKETTGAAAGRSTVVAMRQVYCESPTFMIISLPPCGGGSGWGVKGLLALPASPADLRHVAAVAANCLAAFLAGLARFHGRELVRRTLLMRRAAALGRDRALPLVAHSGEAPAATRNTPRAAGTLSRPRRLWRGAS